MDRSQNKRMGTIKARSGEVTVSSHKNIEAELLWTYDEESKLLREGHHTDVCVPGSRGRGRPRRRWKEDISDWTGLRINNAARSAEDRESWRRVIRAANPSTGGRQ